MTGEQLSGTSEQAAMQSESADCDSRLATWSRPGILDCSGGDKSPLKSPPQ